jgi:endonuclease-3
MNKKQRAQFVSRKLEELFPEPAIPLKHDDPFTLLIAVLLSAQSTDARVNQCTPALFAKARTPKEMASLDPAEIAAIIRPIGLSPSKSRAISRLSHDLITKHKGKVPRSFAALEELPGVGHKTASVVMAQAFHHPAFPVDTHIHRCAKRWGLSKGRNVAETERDLKRCFPRTRWNKLHLQIIYFARTYCPARGHRIEDCPICSNFS